MLKNIPKLLSSELLKVLCDMGHGDEIAIVDANYPAEKYGNIVIKYPGVSATDLLEAILYVFPLDHVEEFPVSVMDLVEVDRLSGMSDPEIWEEIKVILSQASEREISALKKYSRDEFYAQSKTAYAIIQTGEERLYGDIILTKGVIK